jgi:hypothetical protein
MGLKKWPGINYYLAWMVDESCNPTLAGGINYMLSVNFEEITGTLILLLFSRLVFNLSFVSNPLPNNFTHILYNLNVLIQNFKMTLLASTFLYHYMKEKNGTDELP